MKRIFIVILLIFACTNVALAQLETAVWYFGKNAGLDFNTPEPKILLDGALDNLEGVATFSDSLGNLLLYTDGRTVWNRQHKVMLNGDQMVGHVSSTESAIIMPWPGNPHKYLLFVVDAEFGKKGLTYSIVDMRLDDGLGGVTSVKNVPLEDVVCEKVTAIRHENNRDFWLLTRNVPGNNIVEYLVNQSGIVMESRREFPVCHFSIQKDNGMYNPETGMYEATYDPTMAIGYMRIAPNGRKIACANGSASLKYEDGNDGYFINILDVLDFDPATGEVKPWVTYYDREAFLYGVEFSNDVSKLYFTSRRKIFQMDLALPTSQQVINSVMQIGEYPMLTNIDTSYAGALQLALNGKIYVAQRNYGYLGVISNPREKGLESGYIVDGQYLGGRMSYMGLPNFVPTYFLPPKFEISHYCVNEVTHFECVDTRPIDNYDWKLSTTDGALIARGNQREFSHAISQPGKYRITMTINVMGVEHSDYRIFEVYDVPEIHLIEDTLICSGSKVELKPYITDSTTFQWSGFDKDVLVFSKPVKVAGIATDINTGCSNRATVNVSVTDPMKFSLGPDLEFCELSSVTGSATIKMEQYRKWAWTDNGSSETKRVFNKPGKYVAKGLDINYCEVSDTLLVIEHPLPKIDLGGDTILCSNLPRILDCGVPDASYLWTGGHTSQTISPASPGLYKVTVTDVYGCKKADSILLAGRVLPEINLPADTVMCDGSSITLNAFWPDADSYIWNDLNTDFERVVDGPGNFKVDVTNVCGTSSDEVAIRYRYCGEFVFPNIITPNGDGINDFFKIKGLDEFTQGWHIDIYNREGRRVFHSDNYQNEWNAPDVSDGVYFYVFYRDGDRYKGNITVFHR